MSYFIIIVINFIILLGIGMFLKTVNKNVRLNHQTLKKVRMLILFLVLGLGIGFSIIQVKSAFIMIGPFFILIITSIFILIKEKESKNILDKKNKSSQKQEHFTNKNLNQMYDSGIMSKEEYDRRKN